MKKIYRMDLCGYASISAMLSSLISFLIAFAITRDKTLLATASITNGVILILSVVAIVIAYKIDDREGR